MKIFEAAQVRKIDSYTISHEPITSIDLMERAAARLTGWYVRHFHTDRKVMIFAGPGNNGGDALVVARLLAERQFRVACYLLDFGKQSTDCAINQERLVKQGGVDFKVIREGDQLPPIERNHVVVDGIFGSGLTRKVAGFPAVVISFINEHAGTVISIDIPSGLFGEDNTDNDLHHIIRAGTTFTFQFPFLSFFFSDNQPFVGQWKVHDIGLHPSVIAETTTPYNMLEKKDVQGLLPVRDRFSHKGTFGHALMISGSYGMMGAALLAGESCLRGGAGLVTLHIPRSGYNIIQTGFPEAIVSLDRSEHLFSEPPDLSAYSAIGIGPGLGCEQDTCDGLKKLLEICRVPMVIDADGLNILSSQQELLELVPRGSILTPHPREFDRLAGPSINAFRRHQKQLEFASKYGIYVILKGANTGIAAPDGRYWFNTTGNPGMATGGSGDVLTGLITGLVAQGINQLDASLLGVYLHGLAGDLAVRESSREALIAGDIIRHLGKAFRELS